jgi:glycosyltransferase involved in cell wall biosynthesis
VKAVLQGQLNNFKFHTMNGKKRIIFVTSRFPFPLTGGFEIKNFQLIKALSKSYDISAHFIQSEIPSDADVEKLSQYCSIYLHRPQISEVIIRLFTNFILGLPLQSALYYSRSAVEAVKGDLVRADVAICSVIRTCEYIEEFDGPRFFDLADSLGQVYKKNYLLATGWRRLAYWIEGPRLLLKERFLVDNSHGVFFFNKLEASLYSGAPTVHVVPHGVSDGVFNSHNTSFQYADGLSFIGKLNVAHNVDMILWFARHVLPRLPKDLKLYLIGSTPARCLLELSSKDPRIVIAGFLDDPYQALRSSIASICPLQTGGGIQNKIIESLASGAITISSSKAIEALNQPEESGILVCDTPEDWVTVISELLKDPDQHFFRRALGRKYAFSHFSWQSYGDIVLQFLQQGIDNHLENLH